MCRNASVLLTSYSKLLYWNRSFSTAKSVSCKDHNSLTEKLKETKNFAIAWTITLQHSYTTQKRYQTLKTVKVKKQFSEVTACLIKPIQLPLLKENFLYLSVIICSKSLIKFLMHLIGLLYTFHYGTWKLAFLAWFPRKTSLTAAMVH